MPLTYTLTYKCFGNMCSTATRAGPGMIYHESMNDQPIRKIIHVDMDAFFASVEQRDNPELKDEPVAVGHAGTRGVVAAASYEARKFGVHSAMAASIAKRLCPDIVFVAPRFEAYRAVSKQIHEVFAEYTDLVEPLSLDEAYLDVTNNKQNMSSAWTVAQNIRDQIHRRTGLTASAGVSYNKFLAKLASGMNKPDGQYLITPEQGSEFIATLAIPKFHGIGPATADKMRRLGILTGADLRVWSLDDLTASFGKLGQWYYDIARGLDMRPVMAERERKSVSSETTFETDVTTIDRLQQTLAELSADVWKWVAANRRYGRTVTIKIKWADFQQSTRSRTLVVPVSELSELRQTGYELLETLTPIPRGVRLIGVGISGFSSTREAESLQLQLDL